MPETSADPIAICGLAFRFAGGLHAPQDLWDVLRRGRHVARDLPQDRGWDLAALYDPDPGAEGRTYVRRGGFLDDVAGFDAAFFGIGPREAVAMDPQQRLLMEVVWEAVEHARLDPGRLSGTATGVYVGANDSGYRLLAGPSRPGLDGYLLTGGELSVISGRIAYALGLNGPALTVDTACSSSLVALHLAVRALRAGECTMAVAAGTTVIASPAMLVRFSRLRALAADGRSKAFAAEADGFAPAEGIAALLLMPLSRARATGRPVLAVVRGSSINEDGASDRLTTPNGDAQRAVMAAALADAGLEPADVQVMEAHGPGTRAGDPIEAVSLQDAYGPGRPPDRPLLVGSVKSNIGHTQAVAGLAGVIKLVLALQHECLPATLHAANPLAAVDWTGGPLRLLQEPRDWPRGRTPRRAGVLAYGISGTNAHAILEEAPEPDHDVQTEATALPGEAAVFDRGAATVLLLSGKSPQAVRDQAGRLAAHIRSRPRTPTEDIAWSLATTRGAMEHRAVVVGAEPERLVAGLDAASTGDEAPNLVTAIAAPADVGPVFVIPGQGAQWHGMGASLLRQCGVFADAMRECAGALDPHIEFDLLEVVAGAGEADSLRRAEIVQPALFAMYVSLARVWRACGVEPAAVIGHSQGEIAAAHLAGALSLEDAARTVALRSRALRGLTQAGGMVAVAMSVAEAQEFVRPWRGEVEIAVVNSPSTTVLAGPLTALREVLERCAREDRWAQRVPVDYASHCARMDAVRDRVQSDLADVRPGPARIPVYSCATGEPVDGTALDAAYWFANLRRTVRFDTAVARALRDGHRTFVEISPHPVLTAAIQANADAGADAEARAGTAVVVAATLKRDQGGAERFVTALAEAHSQGIQVDWTRALPRGREVDLPTYPFQHQDYWLEPETGTPDAAALGVREAGHPLLGAVAELPDGGVVLTGRLAPADHPWLPDHVVHDIVLVPATALWEVILHTAEKVGCDTVEDLVVHAPMPVPDQEPILLCVTVGAPDPDDRRAVALHSRTAGAPETAPWTHHLDAHLTKAGAGDQPADGEAAWPPADARPLDDDGLYERLQHAGYRYGPAFRNLTGVWRRDGGLFAEASLDDDRAAGEFAMHPALLDAALHPLLLNLEPGRTVLPYAVGSLRLTATDATRLRVSIEPIGRDRYRVEAADPAGRPVIVLDDLLLREASAHQVRTAVAAVAGRRQASVTYRLDWREIPAAADPGDRIEMPSPQGARAAADRGQAVPRSILLDQRRDRNAAAPLIQELHQRTGAVLAELTSLLQDERLAEAQIIVVTRGAQSIGPADPVGDLAGAAVWGMVRTAQTEHPGRVVLVDAAAEEDIALAVATGRPQVVVRHGRAHVPRLLPAAADTLALPEDDAPWRLVPTGGGTLESIRPAAAPDLADPLAPGQVRIAVHAAALNFRDVLVTLGTVDGDAIGYEVAGVVLEAGPGVTALEPGDKVMAALLGDSRPGGLAPVAVADQHCARRVPPGWTMEQAAATPMAFLTARYALAELAAVGPGTKVLIHAAAGGVGMAAVQIARAMGAEVYATAGRGKRDAVAALGVPTDRIADSRDLGFEHRIRAATGGAGVDVVLGSLAGEFVDASLRLLAPGGRYVDMGKTDVRDPADVRRRHSHASYQVFDLRDVDGAVLDRLLEDLMGLFGEQRLLPLPVVGFPCRQAHRALRHLGRAQHTGKVVLRMPVPFDPDGTVLITGGTGTLGAHLARHLAGGLGVRHLLLVSRRGADAPGAADLARELRSHGATVTLAACDTADKDALREVLSSIDPGHPLTAVVHAAGVLDDAGFLNLTPERLRSVLRAKADAAMHLHELTRGHPLRAFVLYSSMAGLLGTAGQGNYAAANTFLDALALHRHAEGLPATSIAWGLWAEASGMTGHLDQADLARLARIGLAPLPTPAALTAFDAALRMGDPLTVAARVSATRDPDTPPPALLEELAPATRRKAERGGAGTEPQITERDRPMTMDELLPLVQTHAAKVLGHRNADAVPVDRPFREAGFDSLAAQELRSRLNTATGLRLTASAIFDHPTPKALAAHLAAKVSGADGDRPAEPERDQPGDLVAGFIQACRAGEHDTGLRLLAEAARQRPTFGSGTGADTSPLVRIHHGPARPVLLFVPPFVPDLSARPYQRLARSVSGPRDGWLVPLPGYAKDQPLPATRQALVENLAQRVLDHPVEAPYALLGHSSGGWIAHELAHRLAESPRPPQSLVLLDVPAAASESVGMRPMVLTRLIDGLHPGMDDAHLTAMAAYAELLDDWAAGPPPPVPVLHLRAGDTEGNGRWPHELHEIDVPGDHFSVLDRDAPTTAQRLSSWLEAHCQTSAGR
ncbi:SDR family NAD(P)-dependent oxidoreductase [Spirillospora sp. NPDC127200]